MRVMRLKDFQVTVVYKDKNVGAKQLHTYDFDEYAELAGLELKRIIFDVEEAFYEMQDQKSKEDWPPEVLGRFNKIRHKLLDWGNSIARLPQTLRYKGIPCNTVNLSELLADIINKEMSDEK